MLPQAQRSFQPQAPDQPNFLQRLMPAAGGILGGLGAAALAPETGGLSLLAPIVGGALGSAAGKGAENVTSGQSVGKDVLGAGLEGAIGQGTGMALGGLMSGASGVLGGVADQGAADAAEQAVASKWNMIPKALRQNLNLNSTAQAFDNYGIDFSPENVAKIAPMITGGDNAILSTGVRTALQGAGPVDLSEAGALVNRIAGSPELAAVGSGKAGQAFENAIIPQLDATFEGNSVKSASAPDVFALVQRLEKASFDPTTPSALQGAYRTLADHLNGALQTAGADSVVAKGVLNPQELQQLAQISPKLADEAAQATTVGQLRTLQKPFVDASKLTGAVLKANEGSLTEATSQPQGMLGQLLQHPAAGLMTGGGFLTRNPLLAGAGLVSEVASNPQIAGAASNALSTVAGAAGGALPGAAGQILTHGADYAPQGGGQPMNPQTQASNPGLDPSQIPQLELAISMLAPSLAGSVIPALEQVKKPAMAQQALDEYEKALHAAGGAQGTLGGILSQFGGQLTGGPARQLSRQRVAAAQAIAEATGQSPEAVLSSLPTLTSTPDAAVNALNAVRSTLGSPIGAMPAGQSLPTGALSSLSSAVH